MVGIRAVLAAFAAALALSVCAGIAHADPKPWSHARREVAPRAGATINGTVIGVDYLSASILLATPHGVIPIAVTPSTAIFRGNSYASFANLGRGMHVEVDAAQLGGRLIAQLIRIL